eukprot:1143901-Pelagomonas_calceolata.AAC.5
MCLQYGRQTRWDDDPHRFDVLYKAFHKAKALGLHRSICPPPTSFASELWGSLPAGQIGRHISEQKDQRLFSRTLPPHIHNAIQKRAHTTLERMASALDYNTQYLHCWSSDPWDFHLLPIYGPPGDKAMTLGLQHAIYSAILNTEATATFMFLPASGNLSPTWLQGLAKDIPEAKLFVKHVRNDAIHIARHPVMPRIGRCEKLPLDKKQVAKLKVADWKSCACTDGSCQVQNGKIGAGAYHPMRDLKNLVESYGADITNTVGRAELAAVAATLQV